jgi:hypothetical protein
MAPTPMTMVQKPLYRNLEIAQNKPSYNRHLTRVLWKDKVGAISMAEIDNRGDLYRYIVLTGGNTMFPGENLT